MGKIQIELFIEPVAPRQYRIVARADEYVMPLDARTFETPEYALRVLSRVFGSLLDGGLVLESHDDPRRGPA